MGYYYINGAVDHPGCSAELHNLVLDGFHNTNHTATLSSLYAPGRLRLPPPHPPPLPLPSSLPSPLSLPPPPLRDKNDPIWGKTNYGAHLPTVLRGNVLPPLSLSVDNLR